MDQVWDNFFAKCQDVCEEGLRCGKLNDETLESLDPAIILGVPACVVLQAAHRSIKPPPDSPPLGPDDWLMSDGVVLSTTNRPRNVVADPLFEPAVALKRDLNRADPDEALWQLLFDAALLQDGSSLSKASCEPPATQLFASASRIALMISRIPMFRRRFGASVKRALANKASSSGPSPVTMGH